MKTLIADIIRLVGFAFVRVVLTIAFFAVASPIWVGGILLVQKADNMWLGLILFGLAVGSLVLSWHLAGGTARRMYFDKLGFRLSLAHTIYWYLGIWSFLPIVGFVFRRFVKVSENPNPFVVESTDMGALREEERKA